MSVNGELLDRFLDDDVSDEERLAVLSWLQVEANMNVFAGRAELQADLRRSLRRRSIQQDALNAVEETNSAKPPALAAGPADAPPTTRTPEASAYGSRLTYVLIAAALATAASLAFVFLGGGTPRDEDSLTPIATVAYQSGAVWSDHVRTTGAVIEAGTLDLKLGLARLDFTNGASVTLQGPAVFEVFSADRTRLQSGVMTAHVPESAIGFEVETPALDVVDLGTAFGISVGEDGLTDVSVFEGEVEVNRLSDDSTADSPKRVVGGQAVRAARQSETIESVAFETERFEQAWPINSGVLQTTGVMKFVSPGPGFVPGRYEDSEHIVVFPERRGVVLDSAMQIDVAHPGEYVRLRDKTPRLLAAGNRVRSYLLQLNPAGRGRTMVLGQITFDNPILGLIASTEKLNQSDSILGHPNGLYKQNRRGLEPPRKEPAGKPDRDSVILAADQRTLILNLGAGSALDQIRVIVSEPDPNTPGKAL